MAAAALRVGHQIHHSPRRAKKIIKKAAVLRTKKKKKSKKSKSERGGFESEGKSQSNISATVAPEYLKAEDFPGSSTGLPRYGRSARKDESSVRDMVLSRVGEYSPVLIFSHKISEVENSFIWTTTPSVNTLACTPGHYLIVSGAMQVASSVAKGDAMHLENGAETSVVHVQNSVRGDCLYYPETASGDIVVDGILVRTYTEYGEPTICHALLLPLRKKWSGLDLTFGLFENGATIEGTKE